MKKTKKLMALVLCAALLLSLAGCGTDTAPENTTPSETIPATTQAPELSAREQYAQAAEKLTESGLIKVTAAITRETSVGANTYSKTAQQHLSWKNWGTDSLEAKVMDTTSIGEQSVRTTEVFQNGTVYMTMGTSAFRSDMTAQDYADRWVSPVPLQEDLYASITAENNGEGTLICFTDPAGLETWAAPEYALLKSASGTAQLDDGGNLTNATYTAEFSQGGAEIRLTAELTISGDAMDLSVEIPADDAECVYVDTPELVYLLSDSYAYLLQFGAATASMTEVYSSEALAMAGTQTTTVAAFGGVNDHMSSIEQAYAIEAYDNGRVVDSYLYQQKEQFRDGVYSISADAGDPEQDTSISGWDMYNYCLDLLTTSYPYISEITSGTVTDFGGICLLELDCSDALAQEYSRSLCEHMTSDPDLLEDLASEFKTTAMDYYVGINRDTGLPTACGISFSGVHTIEEQPYSMTYQSTQTFYMEDPAAYEAITGETAEETAPAKKASPLFYHVTGGDGQQMWLLGTIHLGDNRTGYLPQEIYDALDASDALAVEFDNQSFEQLLSEDEDLLRRVLTSYYYTDGTSAVDHLKPETYVAATKLLKASGNAMVTAMKPFVWKQSMETFYLQQGYGLVSSKGVDARLMEYAREREIEILNVESGIAQIEMLAGFRDEIQELLLQSTLAYGPAEYCLEVQALYEMWCQGDEAALTASLNSESSDLTGQELALYEEYHKALSTDRNVDMLEVAREYLESGDVIFYAVGLAHLLAEDGLVNTLRDAGYTVELVSYGE